MIPLLFLFVLLLACAPPEDAAPPVDRDTTAEAETAFGQGLSHTRQARLAEAESAFRQALALDGGQARYHYHLGAVLEQQGRFQEAETHLQQAAQLDANYPEPRTALGKLLYDVKGDTTRAIPLLKEALDLAPQALAPRYALGLVYQREGQLLVAQEQFAAIVEVDPGYEEAYIQLGLCQLQSGDFATAEKTLKEAGRHTPYAPALFQGLGQALARRGETKGAEIVMARAQDLANQNEELKTYQEAVRRFPKLPQPHFNLASQLARFGRYQQAETHYQQAIDNDSTYISSYEGLGKLYQRRNQDQPALNYYARALAKDSTLAESHNNTGMIYHKQKQLDSAIASYRTAIRHEPERAFFYANLATALRDKEQVAESRQAAEKALELDPTLYGAQVILGDLKAVEGNLQQALAIWQEVAQKVPNDKKLAHKIKRAEEYLAENQ